MGYNHVVAAHGREGSCVWELHRGVKWGGRTHPLHSMYECVALRVFGRISHLCAAENHSLLSTLLSCVPRLLATPKTTDAHNVLGAAQIKVTTGTWPPQGNTCDLLRCRRGVVAILRSDCPWRTAWLNQRVATC